jgi:Tol biopolymer transport system component
MTQSFDPDNLKLIGDPTPVVDQVSSTYETGYFSASPTTLVYRTLNSNAYTQLTWFDSQGKSTGTIGDPGYVGDQVISPDGTRIAYRRDSEDHSDKDLWLLDIARGTSTRFTFGGSWNDAPVWSPDGTQIVFTSNRDGNFDLYRKPANGATNEELLFHTDENKIPWSWSPDGRYLLYGVTLNITGGREDLWVLPMQGDRTPFPFSRTPFDQSEPQFSPDGRWVAYTSSESGQHEVYVRAFAVPPAPTDTGEKWIISNGGGWAPIWRADGKAIAYVGAGRDSWMTVSVATTPSFHAGVPQLLFPFPPGTYTQTAGADLKRFLIAVPASQKGPQTFSVLVNWAPATKN